MRDTGKFFILQCGLDLPGGSDGKESACNVGDLGLIPGLGRTPGEENGNPLQYSCLGIPWIKEPAAGYSPWVHKESDTAEQLHFLSLPGTTMFICPTNLQHSPITVAVR